MNTQPSNNEAQIDPMGMYSVYEAARILGVRQEALYLAIRDGSLSSLPVHGTLKVLAGAEVLQWLEARKDVTAADTTEATT